MKKQLLIVVLALLGAGHVMAQKPATKKGLLETADANIAGQGYGDAGCGLGSIVMGNKPGFSQVFAATTNGTSGNQTFGITTGTSNCGGVNGSNAAVRLPEYIEANKVALQSDIARGSGSTLVGVSNLLGCEHSDALGETLKDDFTTIFPSDSVSSQEASQKLIESIKANKTLAQSCKQLS